MFGTIGSLNVSVACGAFFIWTRQRANLIKILKKMNQDSGSDSFFLFSIISYSTAKFE
jgi:hypothetical protein